MAHFRHNFGDLLFKGKKSGPLISLVHSMMWGNMKDRDRHNISVQSANKGYFESGVQVDRIIRLQFSGVGLGIFYRYGPYHLSKTTDNLALKLGYVIAF